MTALTQQYFYQQNKFVFCLFLKSLVVRYVLTNFTDAGLLSDNRQLSGSNLKKKWKQKQIRKFISAFVKTPYSQIDHTS